MGSERGATRPLLVADLSRRTACALLVTPGGEILPVSPKVQQVAARALSTDVLFDPRPTADPEFSLDEALEWIAGATARNLFQRARRLGLRRSWDRNPREELLLLASPLAVLSSPAARLSAEIRRALPAVAVGLLDALLDPLFEPLAGGLSRGEIEALVILPSDTGRAAGLALRRVLRRRGLRPITFLSRELAVAMARADAPGEILVGDVSDDDLRLHLVAVESAGARRRLRLRGARTVPGLGWPYWVRRIADALVDRHLLPDPPGAVLTSFEPALASLLAGVPGPLDVPAEPPLRLSHGLLEEALDGGWAAQIAAELRPRLAPALAALAGEGASLACLGAACGLRPVQDLLAALSGCPPAPLAAEAPFAERLARGVAAAVVWRRGDATRRIEVVAGGSLRLNTLDGGTCELLPADRLPGPGQSCSLRRRFRLAEGGADAGPLLIHLLWGADSAPEGNASLCALSLGAGAAGGQGREISLALHLARSAGGRRVRATVEAGLEGDEAPPARAFFATDLAGIPPALGDPTEVGL